jgi:hypothetical protein
VQLSKVKTAPPTGASTFDVECFSVAGFNEPATLFVYLSHLQSEI